VVQRLEQTDKFEEKKKVEKKKQQKRKLKMSEPEGDRFLAEIIQHSSEYNNSSHAPQFGVENPVVTVCIAPTAAIRGQNCKTCAGDCVGIQRVTIIRIVFYLCYVSH